MCKELTYRSDTLKWFGCIKLYMRGSILLERWFTATAQSDGGGYLVDCACILSLFLKPVWLFLMLHCSIGRERAMDAHFLLIFLLQWVVDEWTCFLCWRSIHSTRSKSRFRARNNHKQYFLAIRFPSRKHVHWIVCGAWLFALDWDCGYFISLDCFVSLVLVVVSLTSNYLYNYLMTSFVTTLFFSLLSGQQQYEVKKKRREREHNVSMRELSKNCLKIVV